MKRLKPQVTFDLTCGHSWEFDQRPGDTDPPSVFCMLCERLVPVKATQPSLSQ